MEGVFVSICIPTYNGEKYLRQCLDSCLNQDYKNYEIVICDDASTDETVAIIENYMLRHSSIKLFQGKKNAGLVENWNRCIAEAKGEWIKFVFQDDYITTNCLTVFTNSIRSTSQLIVCQRNFILPENADQEMQLYYTQTVRTLENTTTSLKTTFNSKQLSDIALKYMCMNFIGEPSLIFFKKDLVNELGYFNPFLKQICDFEFALRVGTNYGLIYIPEKLCAFRIHANSTTNSNLSGKFFVLKYIEPLLFSYFLIHDTAFEKFRKNLSRLQRFKLHLYFKVKANHAYNVNRAEAHHHFVFDDSNDLFKEIKKIKTGDLFTAFVARIKK